MLLLVTRPHLYTECGTVDKVLTETEQHKQFETASSCVHAYALNLTMQSGCGQQTREEAAQGPGREEAETGGNEGGDSEAPRLSL